MDSHESQWVSIPAAAAILAVGQPAVRRLVREGRLTSRKLPTSYVRVLRSEVEALARESTRPAKT